MWNELVFPYGSILTHSDMNSLFENISALASGDSGSPPIKVAAFLNSSLSFYTSNNGLQPGSAWIPPSGLYALYVDSAVVSAGSHGMSVEINVGGSWRHAGYSSNYIISNSSDVRVRNTTGINQSIRYVRLL